jgi:8-oxo-dGTP diphosphatase
MSSTSIHVAVGVIIDHAGKALVTRRSRDVHQGGLWEFPGGKLKPGEDARTALSRELHEELGLEMDKARPLIRLHHDYPDKSVLLDVWKVTCWQGQPCGREGQPVLWVDIEKLSGLKFPVADETIIKSIQLPSLYIISPGPSTELAGYLSSLEECLKAGTRFLQLRCREEMLSQYPDLVTRVLELCNDRRAVLLLNSSPSTAISYHAHGVHLSSSRLLQLNDRPLGRNYWVSASCHNQHELVHACNIGVDFVVLSPVLPTSSHPGTTTLGWDNFSRLCDLSTVPVYALGGMRPEYMGKAWHCGAQGLAMLSSIWSSSNPAKVISDCIANL